MAEATQLSRVDHSALRVNQACIIALLIIAFVVNLSWLVLLVGVIMLVGTIIGIPGFKPVYVNFVKPRGLLKPDIVLDNPEPHRFSQGLGAVFLLASTIALWTNAIVLGWALSWLVIVLAALNLFGGFCVGCFFYYWLSRLKVPGFIKAPPPGVIPGMRPHQES